MQRGQIYQKGQSWILVYRGTDKKQHRVKLASVDARFPRKRDVEEAGLANKYLNPVNTSASNPDSVQRLSDFIEHLYFDKVERRPSTVFGYKHIFSKHLKERLGDIRVMDFTTGTGQRLMRQIAKEEPHLSKNTLKHIKNFLTGVFTFAKQESIFNGENPMWEVEVPNGNASARPHTHAYTLTEIAALLEALDDVELARTVIATAAFTGLRKGELAGLRWGDLRDGSIYVNRTVWGSKVEEATKTAASKAGVPILPLLANILEEHRDGFADDGFIFAGPKLQRPLDMHNLVNRVIRPALVKAKVPWHGLHSFRRGPTSAPS